MTSQFVRLLIAGEGCVVTLKNKLGLQNSYKMTDLFNYGRSTASGWKSRTIVRLTGWFMRVLPAIFSLRNIVDSWKLGTVFRELDAISISCIGVIFVFA